MRYTHPRLWLHVTDDLTANTTTNIGVSRVQRQWWEGLVIMGKSQEKGQQGKYHDRSLL